MTDPDTDDLIKMICKQIAEEKEWQMELAHPN